MTVLLLAVAGGLGAVARFVVDGEVKRRRPGPLPWATVLVNVSGSLLLGVLVGLVRYHDAPADLRLVLGVGFCGGYTTFSTASVETVRLVQQGRVGAALGVGLGQLVAAVAAGALGLGVTALL
ncbi:hypothetical protein GCM10027047_36160 [Rhodococcus aerolatus]